MTGRLFVLYYVEDVFKTETIYHIRTIFVYNERLAFLYHSFAHFRNMIYLQRFNLLA